MNAKYNDTVIVTTDFAVNTTYDLIRTSVWTDLEGHLGLWPEQQCWIRLQFAEIQKGCEEGGARGLRQ